MITFNEYTVDTGTDYTGEPKRDPKYLRVNKGAAQEGYGDFCHSESLEHQEAPSEEHVHHTE